MCKLFQTSIFCMMTLIVSQTTVSATESDWDLATRKDEFTGKNSEPFLMYKVKIPGTTKGKIELQVVCSLYDKTDQHPHLVSQNTNLKPDDKSRTINHVITVFDSELIQTNWDPNAGHHKSYFRQLNIDEKPSTTTNYLDMYYTNSKFNNVHHSSISSRVTQPDYTNLPKKQEITFVSGKRMNIEFGQMYLNYVKSCFSGRNCRNLGGHYTVCTP